MLTEARRQDVPAALVQGRAEALPVADACMDLATMGYALRHVADLGAAFQEFHRVLRPGGAVLLLEIARPDGRLAQALARLWLGHAVPWACRMAMPGRRTSALMRYYWGHYRGLRAARGDRRSAQASRLRGGVVHHVAGIVPGIPRRARGMTAARVLLVGGTISGPQTCPSARSTSSGVIGTSVMLAPNGASASLTAFITQAAAPAVPASPAPLAPNSESTVGVQRCGCYVAVNTSRKREVRIDRIPVSAEGLALGDPPLCRWRSVSSGSGCAHAFQGSFSAASNLASLALGVLLLTVSEMTGMDVQFANGPGGVLLQATASLGIAWLVVVTCRLVWAPFRIFANLYNENKSLRKSAESLVNTPNTKAEALVVNYEDSANYNVFSADANGARTRWLSIKITNQGDGFLTDCTIYIASVSPSPPDWNRRIISPASALMVGQHKFATVVFYAESKLPGPDIGDVVVLCESPSMVLKTRQTNHIPAPNSEMPAILTIEAGSAGMPPGAGPFPVVGRTAVVSPANGKGVTPLDFRCL